MRPLLAIIALSLIALTLLQSRSANSLPDGSKPVKTETQLHVAPSTPRVDGEILVRDRAGAELGRWYLDAGRVYQPVDAKPGVDVELTRHQYLYDPGLDLGTFAAGGISGDLPRFQVGIRLSPARLAWGVVAPDLAVTQQGLGAGVSLYPPGAYFGRWWDHIGLGAWYLVPYTGEHPTLAVGLSFSTRR